MATRRRIHTASELGRVLEFPANTVIVWCSAVTAAEKIGGACSGAMWRIDWDGVGPDEIQPRR